MSERISDEQFEKLESEHGQIVAVNTVEGECAFRRAKHAEYKRYLDCLFDEKRRSSAQEILVRACVIHPSKEDFGKMLESAPGIAVTCSSALLELCGQVSEPEVRKSAR
jgi:hypothetical protein